ncbi:MAG: EAL domain-containing protein [Candidatus Sumerlaeia bacterium]|nr:EAL domain-containing protein [Candidatus Sumerlaeia bacterium]
MNEPLRELESGVNGALPERPDLLRMGLTAHVMPIHDLRRNDVWGFEVLVRGLHEGNVQAPAGLLELARATGILTAFDRRCLAQTTATAATLSRTTNIFLNVYAMTLLEEGGLDYVVSKLRPLLGETRHVVLEIHESATTAELAELQPLFERIKAEGIRIALDDLMPKDLTHRHLRVRPDYIKIDKSVFEAMTPVEAARTISTFARCQESLGYTLVVEGIEDMQMLSIVTFAGGYLGQGYFFGRPAPPMPSNDAVAILGDLLGE